MHAAVLALALLTQIPILSSDYESDAPPLVEETYDSLWIIHEINERYEITRVYFIRDGKALAERLVTDEMSVQIDGINFRLEWVDYWQATRVVSAPCIHERYVETEAAENDTGPWWAMGRRMTDLAAPETPPGPEQIPDWPIFKGAFRA